MNQIIMSDTYIIAICALLVIGIGFLSVRMFFSILGLGTKKPNKILSTICMGIIGIGALVWCAQLVIGEFNRKTKSYQCVGVVVNTEFAYIGRKRKMTIDQYQCTQYVTTSDGFQGIIMNDYLGNEGKCHAQKGNQVDGYCYNKNFRPYKYSQKSILGIVFLGLIIIFANVLAYNHHQRKKTNK